MKTTVYSLFLAFVFALILTSCNEDNLSESDENTTTGSTVVEKSAMLSASLDDKVSYHKKYLTALGKSVLLLAKEEDFRELVYEEVKKEFDGDYNVLLEMVYNHQQVNLKQRAVNEILKKNEVVVSIDDALEAFDFTDTDGVKYFPQIYIPFFEEHSEQGLKNNNTPIVAIYDGADTEQLVGYTMDSLGRLIEMPYLISEEVAKNEEVWVISINENVEKDEDIERYKEWKKEQQYSSVETIQDFSGARTSQSPYNSCRDGNTSPSSRPPGAGIDVQIENIIVSSHKEPWALGKSEVYAKLTTASDDAADQKLWANTVAGSYNLPALQPYGDFHLKTIRRKDIGCGKLHSFIGKSISKATSLYNRGGVIFENTTDWGEVVSANRSADDIRYPIMFMVIYEKDAGSTTREKDQYITSDPIPGKHEAVTVNILHQTRDDPYYTTWFTWYQDDVYPCLHYDGPRGAYDDSQCDHFLLRTWNPND